MQRGMSQPTAAVDLDPGVYREAAGFWRQLREFLRESEVVARRNGLTPQRYRLLLMTKGAPDGSERASVGDLAEQLQLAQSTTTELIVRAEEAGLVVRETSQTDGRSILVRLTPEGERRLRAVVTELAPDRGSLAQVLRSRRR
jgi:DNA-binding MarR family transcriptional regulator